MKHPFLNTIVVFMLLFPVAVGNSNSVEQKPAEKILVQREMSLDNRHRDRFVNEVFKDNILLTIAYLKKIPINPVSVNWENIKKPFQYKFKLGPEEVFAFHEDVVPEYKGKVAYTTNAHFGAPEGFKTDGYLYGDGVCHLASLINWAAQNTPLEVKSPTRHDFATIPEIPAEYGTSIYSNPEQKGVNSSQNLYIKNNLNTTVYLIFEYDNFQKLKVSIVELQEPVSTI